MWFLTCFSSTLGHPWPFSVLYGSLGLAFVAGQLNLGDFADQGDALWSLTSLASLWKQGVCRLLSFLKTRPLTERSVQGDWVVGWYLSQLSYHPFHFGSCSTINCHCLHWFPIVFGGVLCHPTVSWAYFWLDLGTSWLSSCTLPSSLPPLFPPIFSMPESPPTPSQQRQQAARRLERRRRAMQSPESRRTPVPAVFEFAAPVTPSQLAARYAAPAPAPASPPSVSLKVFVL